jgi:amino acid transporter
MAVAIVVGNVIGSGIFAKPGEIAAHAGDFRIILAAWLAGGALCMLGALCFAELAAMLPRAGGLYVFLREAYGRPVAFLFGFNEFVFGRPASIGALSVFFIELLAGAAGWKGTPLTSAGLAVVVIAGMAWVNVLGVIWGGRLQGLTTLIKAGFLGLIAALPFLLLAWGHSGVSLSNYGTRADPGQVTFTAKFAAVLLAVLWAYNGWHDVAPVAEEIHNPQRNIPLSLLGGVAILIVLYVSANVAYHGVLTMEQIKGAGRDTPQLMIRRLLGPFGGEAATLGVGVLSAVIICSVFGAINGNLLLGPRIAFAMGRDDVFVRQLGAVHGTYHTPAVSICVQASMSALLVVVSAVLVRYVGAFARQSIFDMMTDYVIFSASIFYALGVLAVFVLRWRHPDWERPYRTWGYPLVPFVFLVGSGWFLVQVYSAKPAEARVGVGLILLGIPVYYAWQAWGARRPRHDQAQ